MYPHRCDIHELDRPLGLFGRHLTERQSPPRCASSRSEDEIVESAELHLLSDYIRETTGFRLEKLAEILEIYRDDCRHNDNVTGMQRAAHNIMSLLAASDAA